MLDRIFCGDLNMEGRENKPSRSQDMDISDGNRHVYHDPYFSVREV